MAKSTIVVYVCEMMLHSTAKQMASYWFADFRISFFLGLVLHINELKP